MRGWMLILCITIGVANAVSVDAGPRLTVEAEWYTAMENLGGDAIRPLLTLTASNDSSVVGFDALDEWVSIPVTFSTSGYYTHSLRAAAYLAVQQTVTLILVDDAEPQEQQISVVEYTGAGLG